MTRFISLLVCFLPTICCFGADYIVAPKKLTPTITWSLGKDSVLRIDGSGQMPDYNKTSSVPWLKPKYCNIIKEIVISEGITAIGNNNFNFSEADASPEKYPKITLPKTLLGISLGGLSHCALSDNRLPPSFGSGQLGDCKFPDKEFIVDNAEQGIMPIYGCDVEKVIILNASGRYPAGWKPNKSLKNLKTIEIKTNALTSQAFVHDTITDYYKSDYEALKKRRITLIVGDDFEVTPKLREYYHVVSPKLTAEREQRQLMAERDRTCKGYVENRLEPWEQFIGSKPLPVLPDPEEARQSISADMQQWQKKGEFESTAEWQKRVNDNTIKARAAKLTAQWNAKARKAQAQWNEAVENYKKEYTSRHKQLQNEFYRILTYSKELEYRTDLWSIAGPYDADNQTFLLSSKNHGDILLAVPRAEAKSFKDNWYDVCLSVKYEFVPVSDREVGLSRITFKNQGKYYAYDGKRENRYAVAEPSYDFKPVEITGLLLESESIDPGRLAVATPSARTSGTTIKTQKIERKVQPSPTTASPANTAGSKFTGSDVDTAIPVTSRKNDKTFALVIANENYRRVSPVAYASHDGEMVCRYLNKTLGLPDRNIKHVQDASLNDMQYQLDMMRDICEAYSGEASLIVYYAGHGFPDENGGSAYLLPVDGYAERANSGLSMNRFIETLAAMPAKQVTMLVDACFSGLNRQGESLSETRGVAIKPKPTQARGNMVILTAAQGQQTAQPFTEQQHGMFTYFVLKKLKEAKGDVTLGELSDFVINRVKQESAVNGSPQTPTVNSSPTMSDWRERKL